MNNFKNLKLYSKALDLAETVYSITEKFPRAEQSSLCNQMQRAAVSVGSNIAEGAARNTRKEFYHFLGIANGSAAELHFQLDLAHRRNWISDASRKDVLQLLNEIIRMNSGLQKTLQAEMRMRTRGTEFPTGSNIQSNDTPLSSRK